MAFSVYDPAGRLKKHAFLGTSFAVDPEQAELRKGVSGLYEEMKGGGARGRKEAKKTLESRFKTYEREQANKLANIAEQRQMYNQELANLATEEQTFEEQRLNPYIGPLGGIYPRYWEDREAELKAKAAPIRERVSAGQQKLNKEEEERLKRIMDRFELYNLFLGAE